MMDPATATGLAAAIITFVVFTKDLIHTTRELRVSPSGLTEENEQLKRLTKNIRSFSTNSANQNPKTPIQSTNISNEDQTLLSELQKDCISISDELIQVFNSLKPGSNKLFGTFSSAIKTFWQKSRIDELQQRLDRISNHISQVTAANICFQALNEVQSLSNKYSESEPKIYHQMLEVRGELRDILKCVNENKDQSKIRDKLFDLQRLVYLAKDGSPERVVLLALSFDGMDDRYQIVHEAYPGTAKWIFDENSKDERNTFVDWLQSDEPIYWISGKPGSGKSTLMRYLWDQDKTHELLKVWAGEVPLISAKFFFWAVGGPLQKSQQGLLRSLLYQILRQRPDLIQEQLDDMTQPFPPTTTAGFISAIHRISKSLTSASKICLFIDGLDEYDGDPMDIISLVSGLKKYSPYIKMCVSSRPWTEFEKALGNNTSCKLYMHEINEEDIKLYVQERLGKDADFISLSESNDRYNQIVQNITDSAQGVWLWVVLAVTRVVGGLTHGDKLKDLEDIVKSLPSDLNKFFGQIINSIDQKHQQSSARFFLATLTAALPPPLMLFWYLDDEDLGGILRMKAQELGDGELSSRLGTLRKRLNASCKGLLEAGKDQSAFYGPEVHFLHRTVTEFMRRPEWKGLLENRAGQNFDSELAVLLAVLGSWKSTPSTMKQMAEDLLLFFYASLNKLKEENVPWETELMLLREFVQETKRIGLDCESDKLLRVATITNLPRFCSKVLLGLSDPLLVDPVLADPLTLLSIALSTRTLRIGDGYLVFHSPPGLEIVRLLLDFGVHPYNKFKGQTIWESCINYVHTVRAEVLSSASRGLWFSLLEFLIKKGVNPTKDELLVLSRCVTPGEFEKLQDFAHNRSIDQAENTNSPQPSNQLGEAQDRSKIGLARETEEKKVSFWRKILRRK